MAAPKPKATRGIPEPAGRDLSPRAVGGIILAALLVGLAIAGWWAWGIVSHVEEFPQASDSFGYLQLAQDIRAGHAPNGGPPFTASSGRAREMIDFLRGEIPPEHGPMWESAVAPAAYHRIAGDAVINQYPPGIGWMLAIFPQGKALAAWYAIALAAIAAAAVATAVWTWRKLAIEGSLGALVPAVLFFLVLHTALNVLGTTVSYSIDFFILVALPAVGLLWAAGKVRGRWHIALLILAGMTMGFAVATRLAAVLFVPGMLLAVQAVRTPVEQQRPRWISRLSVLWWILGFIIGVLPLLLHQQRLTGSLLGSTYAAADTAQPELAVLGANLAHYFVGDGSPTNWALLVAALLFIVGMLATRPNQLPWRLAAVLAVWSLPTGYFLLHRITTPYYQFPTIEMTILVMAAMATGGSRARGETGGGWEKAVTFAVLLAAVAHVTVALIAPKPLFAAGAKPPARTFALPDEIKDPRAWVLAERYSGTLWATHGVYAMYMAKADPHTRDVMWRLIRGRGGNVYVIDDRPVAAMKAGPHTLIREATDRQASAEKIGEFEGAPIWRLTWHPEAGAGR